MVAGPVISACGETCSYIPWLRLRLILLVLAWWSMVVHRWSQQITPTYANTMRIGPRI